ncbi:MAG: hypothetical protein M3R29_05525 [Verrucomicrobiota bacterium]|nr:hypothetical protein [Verrucomicrobiota bacterium]
MLISLAAYFEAAEPAIAVASPALSTYRNYDGTAAPGSSEAQTAQSISPAQKALRPSNAAENAQGQSEKTINSCGITAYWRLTAT